jgi:hypothetical protein
VKYNTIEALANLVEGTFVLEHNSASLNRMNSQGESLEAFVQNAFCPIEPNSDLAAGNKLRSEVFSYLGNQNNPPDFMLRGGDAVEVKKVKGKSARIALNSSYPKQNLNRKSKMISAACRNAETWTKKDLLYVIGELSNETSIQHLWFIYGDCYSAEEATYESIRTVIRKGVRELDLDNAETNELGRVNGVDPLGITNLRIRGMWDISGPREVFSGMFPPVDSRPSFFAVMTTEKYLAFPEISRARLENMSDLGVKIKTVEIRSPDNPAKLMDATTIEWTGK